MGFVNCFHVPLMLDSMRLCVGPRLSTLFALFINLSPLRCFYEIRDDCYRFLIHVGVHARLCRCARRRKNGRQKSRLHQERKRKESSLRQEVSILALRPKPLLRGFFTS